jgi:hypothetical protein
LLLDLAGYNSILAGPNYVLLRAVLTRGHFLYEAFENVGRLAKCGGKCPSLPVNQLSINREPYYIVCPIGENLDILDP